MSARSTDSGSREGAPPASTTVIVAVGTDHHPFDRLVDWVGAWAGDHPDVSVLVQRGTSRTTGACPSVALLPHPELCERFAMATAVVSHGGPSTVMDARMAGRLPIVMARDPQFGEHVDDHQMRFAAHLERHELAVVVGDRAALEAALDEALEKPNAFVVPVGASAITGVVEFGRVVDQLLGTRTLLTPSSPAGVEELAPGRTETVPAARVAATKAGSASTSATGSTDRRSAGDGDGDVREPALTTAAAEDGTHDHSEDSGEGNRP